MAANKKDSNLTKSKKKRISWRVKQPQGNLGYMSHDPTAVSPVCKVKSYCTQSNDQSKILVDMNLLADNCASWTLRQYFGFWQGNTVSQWVYHRYYLQKLCVVMVMDNKFVSTVPWRSNKCTQILSFNFGWSWAYLLEQKGKVHGALSQMHEGVSLFIDMDSSKEHCQILRDAGCKKQKEDHWTILPLA